MFTTMFVLSRRGRVTETFRGTVPLSMVLTAVLLGPATVHAQTYGFYRFDDDFSAYSDPARRAQDPLGLKYVPISDDSVLSVGLDDREKVESYVNPLFGLTRDTGYVAHMHRLLLDASLTLPGARLFLQLGNHDEEGRTPTPLPTDIDRADVQQGFIDVSRPLAAGEFIVRLGRQEMSYGEGLLVGVRDGPNIRQDWDGVRAFWKRDGVRLDLFAVHPVENLPGYFDDTDLDTQSLWGAYLTLAPDATRLPVSLDFYYLGTVNDDLHLAFGTAGDHRSTLGVRLYGTVQGWDGVLEPILQTGTFGDRRVDAYALHAELGWTAAAVSFTPRFGAKFDILSGNRNPTTGTVAAFNPLYPNLAYSTEATIEAATNLIEPGATISVVPARDLTVSYEYEALYRQSTSDAFYVAPLIPLVPAGVGANERFTGTEQQLAATWRANPNLSFKMAAVHFSVGQDIRAIHGTDTRYIMGWVALRY